MSAFSRFVSVFSQPHYVRDYRRLVRGLLRNRPRDEAMSAAVGGNYEGTGRVQADFLRNHAGLKDEGFLIDVGCGAGRLSSALRDLPKLKYLGTDVVPELVDYARERCKRNDWNFAVVDGLEIPAPSGLADMVVLFSVLTHLSYGECLAYLQEAARVLRPDGRIVATFLEYGDPQQEAAAGSLTKQWRGRLRGVSVKSTLLDHNRLQGWASQLGFKVQFLGGEFLGQSVAIFSR